MAVIEEPVAALIALVRHCVSVTFTDLCDVCGHSGTPLPPAANCCECSPGLSGTAYLQVERVYPVGTPFPSSASAATPCGGTRMAVEFSVTVYRCVETVNDNGDQPSCEVTTEEMFRNLADMATMRTALLCCLKTEVDDNASLMISLLDQTPLNPQGGCGGTTTRAVASATASILNSPALSVL